MKAVIIHLTDVHFDALQANPILTKTDAIASAIYGHLAGAERCFVVLSGDIAQSGKKTQYDIALKFLSDIEQKLKMETTCEISFVVAPGNHDCDFDRDSNARKGSVKLIESEGISAVDESTIEVCTSVQHDYFEFLNTIEGLGWEGDRLIRTRRFEIGQYEISFETLNISWVSNITEGQGKLYFPHEKYNEVSRGAETNVVVMHHPFNWFNPVSYRDFRKFVRSRASILLTGHEHQSGVSEIEDLDAGKSVALEGSVLQTSKGLAHTGFSVVVIDLATQTYEVTTYLMEGSSYVSQGMGVWTDYRPLPEKRDSGFHVTASFQGLLDDPGAYLATRAGGQLRLPDIYVYPDLRPLSDADEKRRYISSTTLLSREALQNGVLIQGEENTGKTSLLYQLFREHFERGDLPLYILGSNIKRPAIDEIEGAIRRAVIAQYGQDALLAFAQTSKSKKILFFDDFDDCPVRADAARAQILERLEERFQCVLMTVGPLFEMNEIASDGRLDSQIRGFEKFQLQAFGNVKRSELVRRWFEIHADLSIDDGEVLGKRDTAEKLISGVMNKSLISHTPLYMLTLLQSMEDGRSGELKDSALGHYYQFLLTGALQREGVRAEKLSLYYQYCAHLAWEFHISNKQSLSSTALREFNERYTANWSTIELGPTLDLLVRAHVLSRSDDFYSFRYPYIYYFLKGYYINEHIDVEGMREYVMSCCTHLYVRDNANTVLFLAHHASGDFVVSQIAASLHDLFSEQSAIELEEDTAAVTILISKAPEMSYSGGTPEEHRRKRDEVDDHHREHKDAGDGLMEKPELGGELSLAAKLATLMKTSEILGQVLKDQYARIPRARKAELISEIFNGSLRAMGDFFSFMTNHSEKLVHGLRTMIAEEGRTERNEENEAAARLWVANLVQGVTVGLVMRAAQNAGSLDLREDVAAVVQSNSTMAYRMVELATYMDSARPIPRSIVEGIYRDSEANIVVRQVLTILVLHRLYMFKTSESDMNWLAAKIKLRMETQKAIAHHRDEMKKML